MVGVQRVDLRVLRARQVVHIVALNGLVEKGQADQQHCGQNQQKRARASA
jgi:hypothetical protein